MLALLLFPLIAFAQSYQGCGYLLSSRADSSYYRFCDAKEKKEIYLGSALAGKIHELQIRHEYFAKCESQIEPLVCVEGDGKVSRDRLYIEDGEAGLLRPNPFRKGKKLASGALEWEALSIAPGVQVAIAGDVQITKVNPKVAKLVLLNFSQEQFRGTLSTVAKAKRLAFATNASMFAADESTSIGYMKNFDHVNNAKVRLGPFFVFNPKKKGLPAAAIVKSKSEAAKYHTVIQNWRMWKVKKEKSLYYNYTAQVAIDNDGNVLFFYTRRHYEMAELYKYISSLGLGLGEMLYLDGGSHGSLYYDRRAGYSSSDDVFLPNIVGVALPANVAD